MKSSSRNGKRVRLIAVHTTEGIRKVNDLKAFFNRADAQGSSHAAADATGALWGPGQGYVPYDRAAWTLRSGNPVSDNLEYCGWAKYTRGQWLGAEKNGIEAIARWVAERCTARGVPIVKLSPADVKAGKSGVIGHNDWTVGMKDGTHWDPGPGFPWDVVINRARQLAGQGPTPAPSPTPTPISGGALGFRAQHGQTGDHVRRLQEFMVKTFPSYNQYKPTGFYGDATAAGLKEFQRRVGITGPDANGRFCGPATVAQLVKHGFRG